MQKWHLYILPFYKFIYFVLFSCVNCILSCCPLFFKHSIFSKSPDEYCLTQLRNLDKMAALQVLFENRKWTNIPQCIGSAKQVAIATASRVHINNKYISLFSVALCGLKDFSWVYFFTKKNKKKTDAVYLSIYICVIYI